MKNYITIIKSSKSANKHYIKKDGVVVKKSPNFYNNCTAITTKINNLSELKTTLEEVGDNENQVIVLGYIPGTENGKVFNIVSSAKLKQILGHDDIAGLHTINNIKYAARLKSTFVQSSFFIIDRDTIDNAPKKFKFETFEKWWEFMCQFLPGLKNAAYLVAPSNSGRILDNGTLIAPDNHHVYLQAKNAEDIERFGQAALIHAFDHEAGVLKDLKNGGKRIWSIFDPTTFSRERIIYDGKPTTEGSGLSIAHPKIKYVPGKIVDTEKLLNPTPEQQKKINLQIEKNKLLDFNCLTLDLQIEFKNSGTITLGEFKKLSINRERCQSPFRSESTSFAAFVSYTKNGSLFLYDSGSNITYHLKESASDLFSNIDDTQKKFQELFEQLKNETDNDKKIIIAEQICKKVDYERTDFKLMCHNKIRREMRWGKREFNTILNDYHKEWYQSDDKSDWILKNIVVLTEGKGGFYNLDQNIFQTASALNVNYGDYCDMSPNLILTKSDKKIIAIGMGWKPIDEQFFNFQGKKLVNLYQAPKIDPIAGDVSDWIDLCRYIYGEYADLVLDHMAFTLQKPDIKIRWQILTWGKARTGKSMSISPLIKILEHSSSIINNDDLDAGWGDIYKFKKVLVFEEILMNDKRDFNRLKTKLANDDFEQLNIKGQSPILQQNLYSIYMFSNHEDSLRFCEDQKKILVINSPETPLADPFYEKLAKKIETSEFISHCYHFLMSRDITNFKYGVLPVRTNAEKNMIEQSKPDYEKLISGAIEYREDIFNLNIFSFNQILRYLRDHNIRCSQKNLIRVLNDNGCYCHLRSKYENGKRIRGRFWAITEKMSQSEAQKYYETHNKTIF